MVIKDTGFEIVANGVKLDSKKRIVLPKAIVTEGVTYHIYHNSLGQIVLDPQVSIPAYEAWLFNNPESLAKRATTDLNSSNVENAIAGKKDTASKATPAIPENT